MSNEYFFPFRILAGKDMNNHERLVSEFFALVSDGPAQRPASARGPSLARRKAWAPASPDSRKRKQRGAGTGFTKQSALPKRPPRHEHIGMGTDPGGRSNTSGAGASFRLETEAPVATFSPSDNLLPCGNGLRKLWPTRTRWVPGTAT